MRKILVPIILVIGFTINAQELNGVWMSIDDPIENFATANKRANGGIIIDFDDNLIGNLETIPYRPITLNRKKTKIRATGIKGKLKVQTLNQDLLILRGSKRVMYVFKKLDLAHKIDAGREELTNFLINQHCDLIQDIKGRFTAERFFKDKPVQNRYKRNQFINITYRDNGYWYFTKIKGNAFLVFAMGKSTPENIFQVLSLQLKGFNLLQLQNDGDIKDLTMLKTCL